VGSSSRLWRHTQLVLDAVPGRGAGFSLETPTGKRFIVRSRVFDAGELAALGEGRVPGPAKPDPTRPSAPRGRG
jgi:hypothetical protein